MAGKLCQRVLRYDIVDGIIFLLTRCIALLYRKPTFADVEQIYALVANYAEEGMMLARSRNTLYETLRDMIIACDGDRVVGVGALHITWDAMAEVRTMAVAPDSTRQGIGAEIVRRLLDEGRMMGVKKFFTLTYKPGFFQSLGFVTVGRDKLPQKIWKECIDCPKFPDCDEIAMVRNEGAPEKEAEIPFGEILAASSGEVNL